MGKYLAICLLVALTVCQLFGDSSASTENTFASTSRQMLNFTTRMMSGKAGCACVHFYQCINGTFDKHGINQIVYKSGLPDYEYIKSSLLPYHCPEYYTWCCSEPQPGSNETPLHDDIAHEETTSSKPVEVTSQRPLVLGQLQLESNSHEKTGCGYRKRVPAFQYKIIGRNNEAQPKEFPWMVMIMKKDENDPKVIRYQCGGSLLHEKVVLTAAHCAAKIDHRTAVVRAGEHDTRIDEEDPFQDRFVTKILTHPAYDEDTLNNDISLLVTAEPFKFAPNVNIICLPKVDEVIVEGGCLVPGWGKNSTGHSQPVLKKTTLPIVPRDECQSKLRETEELGADFDLHESFLCAGGIKGKDTCQGDGGSPLICPVKGAEDRYQQVGIVAWGIGCGKALPAAYVNVAHFRAWIDDEMKDLSITTDYSYSQSDLP